MNVSPTSPFTRKTRNSLLLIQCFKGSPPQKDMPTLFAGLSVQLYSHKTLGIKSIDEDISMTTSTGWKESKLQLWCHYHYRKTIRKDEASFYTSDSLVGMVNSTKFDLPNPFEGFTWVRRFSFSCWCTFSAFQFSPSLSRCNETSNTPKHPWSVCSSAWFMPKIIKETKKVNMY